MSSSQFESGVGHLQPASKSIVRTAPPAEATALAIPALPAAPRARLRSNKWQIAVATVVLAIAAGVGARVCYENQEVEQTQKARALADAQDGANRKAALALATRRAADARPAPQPQLEAAATPVPYRAAPPGVVYLLDRVSWTNDSGVYGLDAGAKVMVLERRMTVIHVTDGATAFDVKPSQVTDDLDIADLAARRDPDGIRAMAEWRARRR